MKHLFLFGALIIVLFASCSQKVAYTVVHKQPSQEFVGNKFDEFKGKTVNEIMREMSVPNREMPDGADGKILIYEDIKFVTTSSNTHSTHSTSASYGTAVAGYNYRGNPQVNSNAYGSSSTTNTDRGKSVSEEQKKYVNFFINPNGVCYDVKANYGDLYKRIPGKYQTCQKRQMSILGFALWAFPPAGLIYTICYCCMDGKTIKNSCGNIYEE